MSFALSRFDHHFSRGFIIKLVRRTLILFLLGLFLSWFSLVCTGVEQPFSHIRILGVLQRLAKLDIAADSDSEGRGFESLRAGHNQNPVDLCRRDFGFFGSLGDTIRRPNTASRTISPLPAFLFLEKLPAGIRNVFKASQKTCCSLPVSPNGFLKLITSGELWARMNNAEKFERN